MDEGIEENTMINWKKKSQSVLQNTPKSHQSAATGFTIALLHLVNLSSGLCTQQFLNCSEMAQLEMALDSLCYNTLAETMDPEEKKNKLFW